MCGSRGRRLARLSPRHFLSALCARIFRVTFDRFVFGIGGLVGCFGGLGIGFVCTGFLRLVDRRARQVLAARLTLGLIFAARDIDGDHAFDVRVQRDRDLVETNRLYRLGKLNLIARDTEPGRVEDFREVSRRYRPLELAGLSRLTNDDE